MPLLMMKKPISLNNYIFCPFEEKFFSNIFSKRKIAVDSKWKKRGAFRGTCCENSCRFHDIKNLWQNFSQTLGAWAWIPHTMKFH